MSRARIGELSVEQLALVVAALLTPGLIALLALHGEPWRLLDRPVLGGREVDDEFAPSMLRGFAVSLGAALLLALGAAAKLTERRSDRAVTVATTVMVGTAVLLLAPLTHAFYLADAVDVGRLGDPTAEQGVSLDLFMMTGSEWSQAAPYVLMSLYAVAALVTVLGVVAVHAKEHARLPPRRDPPHRAWSARGS